MGKDKLLHIVVSAIIMVVLGWFMHTWVAALATRCVGVGNEVYDKVSGKGCFELMDLVCDCIGVLIGILLIGKNCLAVLLLPHCWCCLLCGQRKVKSITRVDLLLQ